MFFILLLLLFAAAEIKPQDGNLYVSKEKKYFTAAAYALSTNVVVWGVNRFIIGEDWTKVTVDTWKRNLKSSFVFDDDPFKVNQLMHPYHGSLYFSSARVNGLSFWESVPYTMGGSIIWEYFGETTLPSKNDFIGTTMGGIALGETLFRLSNLVLDESASGSERMWREIGAFFISPMHGINRLITGRVSASGKKLNQPPFEGELAVGINNVAADNVFSNLSSQIYLRMRLNYGSMNKDYSIYDAFTKFSIQAGGNFSKESKIPEFNAQGILWGKNLRFDERHNSIAGIFQHYNFIDWNGNQISAHSVGAGIENLLRISSGTELTANLHLAYVVLGGSNLLYDELNQEKYNFSQGVQSKIDLILQNDTFGRIYLEYAPYWIDTFKPVEGKEFIGVLTAEYNYPINTSIGGGIEYKSYRRSGVYQNHKGISDVTSAIRAFVRFTF